MPLVLGHIDLGDLPTWLGVAAASVAALFVFLQLRSQQQQIGRQALALERQQADHVEMQQFWESDLVPDGVDSSALTGKEYWHTTEIINHSKRPIRDLAARLRPSPGAELVEPAVVATFAAEPKTVGKRHVRSLISSYEGPVVDLARAGAAWSFVFPCIADATDLVSTVVRFTDDAGLHWQIDHDMHLTKITRRDW